VMLPIRTAKMAEVVLATASIIQIESTIPSASRCRVVLVREFENKRIQQSAAPTRVEAAIAPMRNYFCCWLLLLACVECS
jgi:hypothetical protein